jgi:hypothetical protein
MIDLALACVVNDLNVHWRASRLVEEDGVILSSLAALDGTAAPAAENKLVALLIGLDEPRDLSGASGFGRGALPSTRNTFDLNLHVMIAANYSPANYREGLKALSEIFTYLKNKPVFNAQNTPQMPPEIHEINLVIEPLGFAETNQIWNALRTPYQPSLNYLLRIR